MSGIVFDALCVALILVGVIGLIAFLRHDAKMRREIRSIEARIEAARRGNGAG